MDKKKKFKKINTQRNISKNFVHNRKEYYWHANIFFFLYSRIRNVNITLKGDGKNFKKKSLVFNFWKSIVSMKIDPNSSSPLLESDDNVCIFSSENRVSDRRTMNRTRKSIKVKRRRKFWRQEPLSEHVFFNSRNRNLLNKIQYLAVFLRSYRFLDVTEHLIINLDFVSIEQTQFFIEIFFIYNLSVYSILSNCKRLLTTNSTNIGFEQRLREFFNENNNEL